MTFTDNPTVPKTCLVVEQKYSAESTAHVFFRYSKHNACAKSRFSLDLAAFSGAVPSPFDHNDKYSRRHKR